MRLVFAAAAAFLLLSPVAMPASAQYDARDLSDMAVDMYRTCRAVARQQPQMTTPEQACACLAGYLGGAMSDRDYDIASRLSRIGTMTESGASQAQIQAETNAYFAAGYTEADGTRVANLMNSMAERGGAVCEPFAGPSPSI